MCLYVNIVKTQTQTFGYDIGHESLINQDTIQLIVISIHSIYLFDSPNIILFEQDINRCIERSLLYNEKLYLLV